MYILDSVIYQNYGEDGCLLQAVKNSEAYSEIKNTFIVNNNADKYLMSLFQSSITIINSTLIDNTAS